VVPLTWEGGEMASNRPPDFGPRLRELREAAGLTQVQLAERAGLHPQGVVKLERGEREPAWSTVVALCAALSVSCERFLESASTGEGAAPGRPRKRTPADLPPAQDKPARRKAPRPRGG
jgi:transcriptional regulator with XRE-family HTH domain